MQGNFSVSCIVVTVWMSISEGQRAVFDLASRDWLVLIYTLLTSLFVHIAYLLFNVACTRALQMEPEIQKSIVIMSSQKTLPFALTVLALLPSDVSTEGIITIPMLVAYLVSARSG